MNVRRAGPRERFERDLALGLAVDQAEALGGRTDDDIVGDREIGDQRQFLKNADDSGLIGGGGGSEFHLTPVERHRPFVRGDDARHHLDERRLARAVFAQNGVDAPRRYGQIGTLKGAHAPITL